MPTEMQSWELEGMRERVLDMLIDRANVRRITNTDSPYGGETTVEAEVDTAVPCFLNPYTEGVYEVQERVIEPENIMVVMEWNANVQTSDILVITTKGNMRLRVEGVFDPESYPVVKRLECSNA